MRCGVIIQDDLQDLQEEQSKGNQTVKPIETCEFFSFQSSNPFILPLSFSSQQFLRTFHEFPFLKLPPNIPKLPPQVKAHPLTSASHQSHLLFPSCQKLKPNILPEQLYHQSNVYDKIRRNNHRLRPRGHAARWCVRESRTQDSSDRTCTYRRMLRQVSSPTPHRKIANSRTIY